MKTLCLPNASVRFLLLALLFLSPFIRVQAATLTVCASGCDFSDVQAAIHAAQPGDTVQIGSGEFPANLIISKNITLQGQGADQTILFGGKATYESVVTVSHGYIVELHKLAIKGGFSSTVGGGINNQGVLKLVDCSILQNTAGLFGGAIFNANDLIVENCDIQGNEAFGLGSAIYNEKTVRILKSAIHDHRSNVSILANAADYAYLGIINSTISNNRGIDFFSTNNSVFDLDKVTVVEATNDLTSLFVIGAGTFRIASSIISGGLTASNCNYDKTTATSLGNNVSSDDSCQLSQATDLQNAKNINLGPLQVIGNGQIPVHPLLPGSVAIDKFDCFSELFDQRGVARPQGPGCDSGAFELQVPIAKDDMFTLAQGATLNTSTAGIPGVLANDQAPDGVPFVVDYASDAGHGSVVVSVAGDLLYVPFNDGFYGKDSFTYTIIDDVNHTATATVTIDVKPANYPPVAQNDSYTVFADHTLSVAVADGLLANDSDQDGSTLTAVIVGLPTHGALVTSPNGLFSYTPEAGFIGTDSFTYQASDGQLLSNLATVTITVAPYLSTITIVEDTQPDSPTNFKFTGSFGGFILDNPAVDDGDTYSNSKTFNVQPGTYTFRQTKSAGWLTTDIICNPLGDTRADLSLNNVQVTVGGGDNVTCTFVNQRPGRLSAKVYNDLNFDLRRNAGEPWLANWDVQLYVYSPSETPASQWTNATGQALFSNLKPGNYTVCEVLQTGWDNLSPRGLDPIFGQPCYSVEVKPGLTTQVQFGNRPLP